MNEANRDKVETVLLALAWTGFGIIIGLVFGALLEHARFLSAVQ